MNTTESVLLDTEIRYRSVLDSFQIPLIGSGRVEGSSPIDRVTGLRDRSQFQCLPRTSRTGNTLLATPPSGRESLRIWPRWFANSTVLLFPKSSKRPGPRPNGISPPPRARNRNIPSCSHAARVGESGAFVPVVWTQSPLSGDPSGRNIRHPLFGTECEWRALERTTMASIEVRPGVHSAAWRFTKCDRTRRLRRRAEARRRFPQTIRIMPACH
jgi:hypothetical protein